MRFDAGSRVGSVLRAYQLTPTSFGVFCERKSLRIHSLFSKMESDEVFFCYQTMGCQQKWLHADPPARLVDGKDLFSRAVA